MVANLSPVRVLEPSPRARRLRRATVAALVICAVAVVGACVWGGLRVLYEISPPSPPYHPENASWRYGQRLMEDQLYSTVRTDDVEGACRAALRNPVAPPSHFDTDQAVFGCRYAEWAFDN